MTGKNTIGKILTTRVAIADEEGFVPLGIDYADRFFKVEKRKGDVFLLTPIERMDFKETDK